ncbi:NADPH:quinone oxidoreductase family protein [Marivibrio halodurans]|uniref:NADPH:quinone oxidoreductase family protein n=1 Tax=Marivibrio halodurans TaxID=2039722 RepID=A0A8J7S2C3_9PROT|nr:NADPH:quinone oxidoreductase family protein [Marivibrio halodurans]MBP5855429.1 NADPH:quinone oxidoreductase family protein [Marivibrio halodurans]
MRALLCKTYGGIDDLSEEEVASPKPGPGEVRVKVAACGVNFPDTLIVAGKYQFKPDPPFSPGGEISGVVDALGEGVTAVAVGDSVVATTLWGGFAEEIVIAADKVMRRPEAMDPVIAAGFSMTYGTAIHALVQRGALKRGEALLVLGASGGVGMAAVEIGKALGATVIAAASSADKLAIAKEAGADITINYTDQPLKDAVKEATGGKGADVVFDPVGGDFTEQALRATGWGGRLLIIGFAAGAIPKIPANLTLLKGCAVVGVFWGDFVRREPEANRANFDRLFAWVADGTLKPLVSETFALADAPEALRRLAARQAVGKLVVDLTK